MGGGDFTGNGSVEWNVQGDHVREHHSDPKGGKGRQHRGIDETPDGGVQYFTVAIKLPKDAGERTAFVTALRSELESGMDPIVVRLPIEDKDHGGPTAGQIRVDWPSRP